MVDKLEACADCARNCRLIHGRKEDPYATVTSFFKVMIGDDYSQILFLPPKFARTIPGLINQKTQLEDSTGFKWTVKLSKVDGSLAFQDGWNAFSLDHGLQVGDLLVFHYIKGSHFDVQIYGRSGCHDNRHYRDNNNRAKRMKTKGNMEASNGPLHMNCDDFHPDTPVGYSLDNGIRQPLQKAASNSQGLDNNVGEVHVSETQGQQKSSSKCKDLNNGGGGLQVVSENQHRQKTASNAKGLDDDGGRIHIAAETQCQQKPASNAEGLKNDRGTSRNVSETQQKNFAPTTKDYDNSCGRFCNVSEQQYMEEPFILIDGDSRNVHGEDRSSLFDLSNCELPKITTHPSPVSKDPFNLSGDVIKTHVDETVKHEKKRAAVSKETHKPKERTIGHQKSDRSHPTTNFSSRMMEVTKKEPVETSGTDSWEEKLHGHEAKRLKGVGQATSPVVKGISILEEVKAEPVDFDDAFPPDATCVPSIVVVGEEAYLELPTSFPSTINRRASSDRRVVYLRGPDKRAWPVLYFEKYGIKVLKCGWETFKKANRIQSGDQCLFKLENGQESIFGVSIAGK